MRRTIFLLFFICFTGVLLSAQTIEDLFQNDEYEALAEYANKTKDLSARELYCVGYGLYRVDQDREAIKLYDQAIEKGLDSAYVYRRRGRARIYLKELTEARADFRMAIARDPEGQPNYTEMGMAYAYDDMQDSAMVYLRKARELPFASLTPYTMIPRIFAENDDLKGAREEYAVSAAMLDANSDAYLEFLGEIGRQAYVISNDFPHSVRVYSDLMRRAPEEYGMYPRLIKALVANEEFDRADSVFAIMQEAHKAEKLGEEFTKYGRVGIDEFEWKGQLIVTYRYLELPTELLKPIYIAFLLEADGEKVDRIVLTEKTMQIEDSGSKHLLCEQMDNGHATYSYGWDTDDIPYSNFKKAVVGVLDGEIAVGASSSYGGDSNEKKGKKKKKKK
jgi:tetratricopeptide (TPR) repeat protein